jgi:hypothetical protein
LATPQQHPTRRHHHCVRPRRANRFSLCG